MIINLMNANNAMSPEMVESIVNIFNYIGTFTPDGSNSSTTFGETQSSNATAYVMRDGVAGSANRATVQVTISLDAGDSLGADSLSGLELNLDSVAPFGAVDEAPVQAVECLSFNSDTGETDDEIKLVMKATSDGSSSTSFAFTVAEDVNAKAYARKAVATFVVLFA